jgi:hypothetical protein
LTYKFFYEIKTGGPPQELCGPLEGRGPQVEKHWPRLSSDLQESQIRKTSIFTSARNGTRATILLSFKIKLKNGKKMSSSIQK